MTIWIILGALVFAALVWLGRRGARKGGDWRAGAGVLSVALSVGAIVSAMRGGYLFAGFLLLLAGVLAGGTRLRVGSRPGPRASEALSESEARSILGVGPEAGPDEIRAAYRRLMALAHPDKGGTEGLAARLNAARDRLLKR